MQLFSVSPVFLRRRLTAERFMSGPMYHPNSGTVTFDAAQKGQNNHRCSATGSTDWSYRILVTALASVAVWLMAMPWVPAIARCTMNRFHLQTHSFAAWAIQQPIPPMYSFANTTEVRNRPPGAGSEASPDMNPGDGVIAGRTINHFPTREFTFANARARYLVDQTSKWFVLQSTYRGQTIESVYRLDPAAGNGWNVTLVKDENPRQKNEP